MGWPIKAIQRFVPKNFDEIFGNKDLKGTTICKAKKCDNYLYKNESPSLKGYCMDCG